MILKTVGESTGQAREMVEPWLCGGGLCPFGNVASIGLARCRLRAVPLRAIVVPGAVCSRPHCWRDEKQFESGPPFYYKRIHGAACKCAPYDIAYIDRIFAMAYTAVMSRNPPAQLARNASQIGAIVRRARRARGLTQAQLAAKVGVRQATISSLERGESGTGLRILLDVLAALNLQLLIDERGKASSEDIERLF